MCTAISMGRYFARNLDLHLSFGEGVTVIPRNFPALFGGEMPRFGVIGIGAVREGYPLLYDGVNEAGLAAAGLNFPESAVYRRQGDGGVASFELLPWILTRFSSVTEAVAALEATFVTDRPFSRDLPPSPLHWIISDGERSVAVEPTAEGLLLHDDPVGVLTNEPPLSYHQYNLRYHMGVTAQTAQNRLSPALELTPFSLGMGGVGLPGDASSPSRFVRAVFGRENSPVSEDEGECVAQAFHLLSSVAQPKGWTQVEGGALEYTVYSAVADRERGVYYYTTYENSRLIAADMHREDLDGESLAFYPLRREWDVRWER